MNLVSKWSSSSRHSRMRQTDSISSERANSIHELRVSTGEWSVIRRRKRSFLITQRASADCKSITIIVAVLEYHFGRVPSVNCHRETSSHTHKGELVYITHVATCLNQRTT